MQLLMFLLAHLLVTFFPYLDNTLICCVWHTTRVLYTVYTVGCVTLVGLYLRSRQAKINIILISAALISRFHRLLLWLQYHLLSLLILNFSLTAVMPLAYGTRPNVQSLFFSMEIRIMI